MSHALIAGLFQFSMNTFHPCSNTVMQFVGNMASILHYTTAIKQQARVNGQLVPIYPNSFRDKKHTHWNIGWS